MKIELKDRDVAMIDRIADITDYDYISNIDTKNYIEVDFLLDILSDLETAYLGLKEKHERLEMDIHENYIPKIVIEVEHGE